jgi:hypothetical protein
MQKRSRILFLSAEGRNFVELQRIKDAAIHAKLYLAGFEDEYSFAPTLPESNIDSESKDGETIDLKSLMVFGRI